MGNGVFNQCYASLLSTRHILKFLDPVTGVAASEADKEALLCYFCTYDVKEMLIDERERLEEEKL